MVKVGVKFCGGCNPRFDRSSLLAQIKERYKGVALFEPAREEESYDRLLVISGCPRACAGYGHLHYAGEPIHLWEEGQTGRLEVLQSES